MKQCLRLHHTNEAAYGREAGKPVAHTPSLSIVGPSVPAFRGRIRQSALDGELPKARAFAFPCSHYRWGSQSLQSREHTQRTATVVAVTEGIFFSTKKQSFIPFARAGFQRSFSSHQNCLSFLTLLPPLLGFFHLSFCNSSN